jgi:hypothetical protein
MLIHNVPEALSYLPRDIGVILIGAPGIGKTAIVHSSIEEGEEFFEFQAPSSLPEDARGIPFFKDGMTVFNPPEWFARYSYNMLESEPDESVVATIFVDELPSAPQGVQLVFQKIMQERQVDMRKLHPNVRVVAAGNRKEDFAMVSDMPAPLRSKILWLNCEPHLGARYPDEEKGWIQWAQENDLSSEVISFLRFRTNLFCETDPDKYKQGSPNPRTWHRTSRIMQGDAPDNMKLEFIHGCVGEGPGSEFWQYRKVYPQLPTMKDIEKDPLGASYQSDDPSFQYAVIGYMVDNIKENKKLIDPCLKYGTRFPADFKMMFLGDIIAIGKEMVKTLYQNKTFQDEGFIDLVEKMVD